MRISSPALTGVIGPGDTRKENLARLTDGSGNCASRFLLHRLGLSPRRQPSALTRTDRREIDAGTSRTSEVTSGSVSLDNERYLDEVHLRKERVFPAEAFESEEPLRERVS